jgi:hypothetical protein
VKDRRNDTDAPRHSGDDRPPRKAPPHVDWGAGEDAPPPDAAPPRRDRRPPDAHADADLPPSTEPGVADAPPPVPDAAERHPSPEAGAPPSDSAAAERPSSTETPGDAPAPEPAVADEGPPSTEAAAPPDAAPPEIGKAAADGLPPEPAPSAPPGEAEVDAAAPVDEAAPEAAEAYAALEAQVPAAPEAAEAYAALEAQVPAAPAGEPYLNVLEVRGMDWRAVRDAVANPIGGERAERIIERLEERLAGGGQLGLAFEEYAAGPDDRAIQIGERWPLGEVWFVGDVHGDLLALEAALQHIDRSGGGADARVVFLGDLFDDGVHAAEVVLRVFELVLDGPMRVTVLAGNHDEALAFADGRFTSTVLPSDFTDWLNANPEHPWAARLGRLIIRFFQRAPRALFFPDGLLVAHGGVPHTDLHPELLAGTDWNDPRVLQDFVWLRAHPRARKRIPNRTTRGSEFGREDFAAFCEVATRLGRPVERMIRGHDHVEERFAVYPAWARHPALTINTMSHRLPREVFGAYERVPVVARWVRGELPEVRRLLVPPRLIQEIYPEPPREEEAG